MLRNRRERGVADRVVAVLEHVRDRRPRRVRTARGRHCRGWAGRGNRSAERIGPFWVHFASAAKWISSPSNVKTSAELARAKLQCGRRDGVEHRLHIGRRLADHAQDLARRRLLLQRFLRLH